MEAESLFISTKISQPNWACFSAQRAAASRREREETRENIGQTWGDMHVASLFSLYQFISGGGLE